MDTKYDLYQTSNRTHELIDSIKQKFSNDTLGQPFDLYPFCNELGWPDIIKQLQSIQCTTHDINVSVLFGESNFISLLPWISSSLILIADINPKLHAFTQFLMRCFQKSDSPATFFEYFVSEVLALQLWDFEKQENLSLKTYSALIKQSMDQLGKYHFLSNQKTFDLCKSHFSKVTIVNIYLDFRNKNEFEKLHAILDEYQAKIVFTNITNVHHYVEKEQIQNSLQHLFKNNHHPLITYAEKLGDYFELRAISVIEINTLFCIKPIFHDGRYDCYLEMLESYPRVFSKFIEKNPSFIKINNENKAKDSQSFCYLGYATSKQNIIKFLNNKEELPAHRHDFRVLDTMQEAKDHMQQKGDASWIITFRGSKEKINKKLRFFNNEWVMDQFSARTQLVSRAIRATNLEGSTIIEKEDAMNDRSCDLVP